jgi:hypothetical protein
MPSKVTYEFAVIRVVPKVEREEFMNVGVLVFSKPKRYLGMKFRVDADRLRAFAPELDPALVGRHLEAWQRIGAGTPDSGPIGRLELPERFRWLTAARSTILQCSRPHPGLCIDPGQVLEELFGLYVASP